MYGQLDGLEKFIEMFRSFADSDLRNLVSCFVIDVSTIVSNSSYSTFGGSFYRSVFVPCTQYERRLRRHFS